MHIAQPVPLPWQQHTVAIFCACVAFGSKHTTRLHKSFFPFGWFSQVLCCCLPLSARQKGFPPWTHFLRAIPCNHAWHAVTDMSNVPRTPATPSVPPPEPCVCVLACRNLRSHHTSITHHRLTGSKQPRLALTLSFCQCQRTTPHGPIVLLSLLACFPKLSACLPHHAIPSSM